MENKDGEFNIEDELASIKPRRSDDNPIPARVARQREESIKRAAIEHEKDYYADKKPKKTNTHHTFNNHNNENDWFDTIHESTESVPTSLSDCFPVIPTNEIYLQSGEKCYFKGIIQLVETKVQKIIYINHWDVQLQDYLKEIGGGVVCLGEKKLGNIQRHNTLRESYMLLTNVQFL